MEVNCEIDVKHYSASVTMATTFAVTGFQRPRRSSSYYRPSYHSDLDPIYEDPVAYKRQSSCIRICGSKTTLYHDYEDITAVSNSELKSSRPQNHPPRMSTAMLNGMMNRHAARTRPNRRNNNNNENKANKNDTDNSDSMSNSSDDSDKAIKTISVVIDETDSATVKHVQFKADPIEEPNNNTIVNGLNTALRLAARENGDIKQSDVPALDIDPDLDGRLSRVSSLYMGAGTPRTSEDDVSLDENGFAVKTWPKREPKTSPFQKYLQCPGEKKMKTRCFAACFVFLMIVIGVFVLGIVEGWMYTQTGQGLDGGEERMLTIKGSELNITEA